MTTTISTGVNTRDIMAELFTTAVSTLGAKQGRQKVLHGGAYDDTSSREARLRELTHTVALANPRWMLSFIQWLRDEGHVRTVTIMIACEFVKARLDAKVPDETSNEVPSVNRTAINVACGQANEPGEIINYWTRTYGRNLPAAVKKGAADAVQRLYTERSALYNDGQRADWRLGDVIELVHPKPAGDWQGALFEWLLDRRHGRKQTPASVLDFLPVVSNYERFAKMRTLDRDGARRWLLDDPNRLRQAGLTWEDLAGLGTMDKEAWQAVIPFMGYKALLRNLRNFDGVGVDQAVTDEVSKRLVDPDFVERAGMFPLSFYAAAREVKGSRWDSVLEEAVHLSLTNVPELMGNTLVLVDVSGSMGAPVSERSTVTYREHAQLFGTALAMRAEKADLVQFDTRTQDVPFKRYPKGQVLATARSFTGGGGTDTHSAVKKTLKKNHTRVVIVTDEQATDQGNIQKMVGPSRPLYIFNVAGYSPTMTQPGMPLHRGFGGLTDQAFRLMTLAERGAKEDWPFPY